MAVSVAAAVAVAVVEALTSPVEAARCSWSVVVALSAPLALGSRLVPVDARCSWSAVVTVAAEGVLVSRLAPVAAAIRPARLLNSLERGLQAMERVSRLCISTRSDCTFNVAKVSKIKRINLPMIRKPTVFPNFAR